jgi:hypothetical protein
MPKESPAAMDSVFNKSGMSMGQFSNFSFNGNGTFGGVDLPDAHSLEELDELDDGFETPTAGSMQEIQSPLGN